jgi:hypothetical protein
MGLLQKKNSKQFEETINLIDPPIESVDSSAGVRKLKSINIHRTGSKDNYEPADNTQISSKNLVCEKRRNEFFGEALAEKRIYDFSQANEVFKLVVSLMLVDANLYSITEARKRKGTKFISAIKRWTNLLKKEYIIEIKQAYKIDDIKIEGFIFVISSLGLILLSTESDLFILLK